MEGEAQEMGVEITRIMKDQLNEPKKKDQPVCLIFGGETTVTHSGQGKGGRNQELALAALIELQDFNKDYAFLSAGTDGTDGPTDAAGAVISKRVLTNMENLELQPEAFLQKHNSYTFFEKTDGLLKTGPTGTNVMDLVIVLME
jgi:glycerate-2-kinase